MSGVGLIINATAARDVRRLTSLARTIDVHERVNVVARVLAGLLAGGATRIRYMPEPCHVVPRAIEALAAVGVSIDPAAVDLEPVRLSGGEDAGDAAGTTAAAAAMADEGLACIVTIGGDGTNRAVVAGWPDAVLVPLPGGTNNAFAISIDPTAAGIAAARFTARSADFAGHLRPVPVLEVLIAGGRSTIALVDVAVVRGTWVGAHAIWEPDLLVEAIVARSDPTVSGLAGVGGMVHPLNGEVAALHLRFGGEGRRVLAPLGPGQIVPMVIRDWRAVGPREAVTVPGPNGPDAGGPVTLAFDGEREIVLRPGESAEVTLVADGPRVIDAAELLRGTGGLLG